MRNITHIGALCSHGTKNNQHNSTQLQTQLRTMSDGNICSDDKKYRGFGAAMANSLVVSSKSKLSGLVNVFILVLPLYAGGSGGAASFFLATDNGEFNHGGGDAATNSGYSGSGSKGGGHSMAAASFDGGHATISRGATRGREGSAMRGQEGGTTRGKTTTSRRKTARWWRSERTKRGRDGGATGGDATTRRRDETTRGQRSERTMRGQECGAMRR